MLTASFFYANKGRRFTVNEKLIKGGLSGLTAIISFMAGNFTPLIFILVGAEVFDYISGMYVSYLKGGWSSKIAIDGFFKKVFYFFMVAVGFGFDYMIYEMVNVLDINIDYTGIFGILSVCYLLSTEFISILENLEKINITVPFLTNALKVLREKIEQKGSE